MEDYRRWLQSCLAAGIPALTLEQMYDTILCDDEFNPLYRKHGQLKVKKKKK